MATAPAPRHKTTHHLSARSDVHGWVESISALTETTPATELMLADTEGAPRQAAANGSAQEAEPSQFEVQMQHTVETLIEEVGKVGEALVTIGAGGSWTTAGQDAADMERALAGLDKALTARGIAANIVRTRSLPNGKEGKAALSTEVLARREAGEGASSMEIRVAVIGNVDSGKSTMVGVLTRSILDDGRGFARSKVFKHGHEEATGRTSSIGQHNLCLDARGIILNDHMFRMNSSAEYIARSSKVVTLVDLAGHERYFKTTAYGLTGHLPDYACLIVGANAGIVGMCKEHFGVALALKVPVFFVVTKVDICPEHVLQHTLASLQTILRKPGVKKKPFMVRTQDDVITCARHMHTDSLAPIFLTSAVTGQGLDMVRTFYNLLPQRHRWYDKAEEAAEFIIDETFGVPGVGTVVAGMVKRGVISTNSTTLLLGPHVGDATFKPAAIKSIHYKRLPVTKVVAGQTAALALKKVRRGAVRKGMVLCDVRNAPVACWEFDADIAILTHATTIQPRYQAVIHCEIVRQAARVVAMNQERLRSGDRATVRFRFLQRPEYLTPGTRFVFREGRTKGIGMIVARVPEATLATK